MKMTKRTGAIIMVPILLLISISVHAREFTGPEVRRAVETWVRHVTPGARPDAVVQTLEPFMIDGETSAYIAHLSGGGFCLCGADETVLPVYWYSPGGTYDPDISDFAYILGEIAALRDTLNMMRSRGAGAFQRLQPVLRERAELWEDLLDRRIPTRRQIRNNSRKKALPDSMSLGLTTIWGQDEPYNMQCPELPYSGLNCKVGCVATAQAQIMNYWQWPPSGNGSKTWFYEYRWTDDWIEEPLAVDPALNISGWWVDRLDYDTTAAVLRMNGYWDHSFYLAARDKSDSTGYKGALESLWSRMEEDTTWLQINYSASTYQWDLMADSATAFSAAGRDAVAELCYHAGVSCHMNYHVFVSTTNEGEMIKGLEDHFFYDSDARTCGLNIDTMTEEIQWLRPFVISGVNTVGPGSHTWTCFGYDTATDPDREIKMNMGWDGRGDGWFTYDTVATLGFVFEVTNNTKQIAPNSVRFVGSTDPGDGSPDEPYLDIAEALLEAPDHSTLIFKAGSENTFPDSLIINRPFILKGREVTLHSSDACSSPGRSDITREYRSKDLVPNKHRTKRKKR
jgi:hypothetical protein